MSNNGNHIRQYNADDIRRYLEGGMSSAEMHAIEKAALDDPFLSDAIDGYAAVKDEEQQKAVLAARRDLDTALASKLSGNKKSGGRVVGFKWWQTAAAAVIIISAAVLGYLAYDDKAGSTILSETTDIVRPENQASAIADSSAMPSAAATFGADSAAPAAATLAKQAPAARENKEETIASRQSKEETLMASRKAEKTIAAGNQKKQIPKNEEEVTAEKALQNAAPPVVENKTTAYQSAVGDRRDTDSLRNIPQPPAAVLQGRVAGVAITKNRSARKNSDDDTKYFNGQLLTPDNRPLSNAVLLVENDQKKYSTDNNGKFTIPSADSTLVVEIAMAGQNPQRFTLNRNPELNKLVLPGSIEQMNEVVVVGYGSERKKEAEGADAKAANNASPVGGWPAFEKYLSENKADSLINNPPKNMRITFTITGKNKLSDFVITNSISPAHDKEAIRLIRQGPGWQVTRGRKASVTLDLTF